MNMAHLLDESDGLRCTRQERHDETYPCVTIPSREIGETCGRELVQNLGCRIIKVLQELRLHGLLVDSGDRGRRQRVEVVFIPGSLGSPALRWKVPADRAERPRPFRRLKCPPMPSTGTGGHSDDAWCGQPEEGAYCSADRVPLDRLGIRVVALLVIGGTAMLGRDDQAPPGLGRDAGDESERDRGSEAAEGEARPGSRAVGRDGATSGGGSAFSTARV